MSEKHNLYDLTAFAELIGEQKAKLESLDTHNVDAVLVMDSMRDLDHELFAEWRAEINKLLDPEYVNDFIATPRGMKNEYGWHLPDHELTLDVTAPFVPFDLHGELTVEGQVLPWNAMLDLDSSYEIPGTVRRKICVFCVVEVPK